jgi:hypothetical protein
MIKTAAVSANWCTDEVAAPIVEGNRTGIVFDEVARALLKRLSHPSVLVRAIYLVPTTTATNHRDMDREVLFYLCPRLKLGQKMLVVAVVRVRGGRCLARHVPE